MTLWGLGVVGGCLWGMGSFGAVGGCEGLLFCGVCFGLILGFWGLMRWSDICYSSFLQG